MKTRILILLTSLNLAVFSQVSVSTGSYFEDFGTTDISSWTNNTTVAGWYSSASLQAHVNITTAAPSNTGGFYTYECNGNNDQKIGSRASGGSGTLRYGVVLKNTTGALVSNIKVSYTGYQLSLSQNGAVNTIAFDYIVNTIPPTISSGGGTSVSALNFTQLQSNSSSGSAQVLGYPCTQSTLLSACITVSIPNNSYILLRWTDTDDAGNDHHMAIDDVNVQFLANTLTVNSPTICSTETTTLTAMGATNYTWSPSAGLSSPTGSMVTANPIATTIYTLTGSIDLCPAKTTTATITVTSNPLITVNSESICASGTATLTASGANTYTWNPAIGLSASTGSVVTASPSATTIYTVSGTLGTCPTTPATATVTIFSGPTITVNSASICAGGTATLTASGASSYTWGPGSGLSSSTGSVVTASPLSTTVYTVSGNAGGCAAVPVTTTVTILASPFITVNSGSVCAGNTTTLNASGASSYTWTPAISLSSSVGSTVTASPASTTIYTISGQMGSCMATSATATVTVFSNPVISVSSTSVCANGTASLTVSGAVAYTWTPSSGLSASTGSVVSTTPTVTSIYTVTGSDGHCFSNPVTSTVTIISNPALSVNSNSICANSNTVLNANGANTYTWSPAAGLSTTTGSMVTSSPSSTTIYTITGSLNGCSNTITSTVTVIPLQNASFSYASNNYCQNATNPLPSIAGTTGGAFMASPTGLSISATTGLINLASSIQNTYTVSYSTTGSCPDSKNLILQINSSPSLTTSSIAICEGASAVITATASSPGGSYLWQPGNQKTAAISVSPTTTTTYSVTYSLNGCQASQLSVVWVHPKPSPMILPSTGAIMEGESVILEASGGDTYMWSTGNTNASIQVQPQETTEYCVTATDIYSCSHSACLSILVNNESTLYVPNVFTPNKDGINDTFHVPYTNIKEFTISIFNRWGQEVFHSNTIESGWDGTFQGQDVSDGVYSYILNAKGNDHKIYEKQGHITLLK